MDINDNVADNNRIRFTYKGISRTMAYYADVLEVLTGMGINIPKSVGLSYRDKQKIIEEYLVPIEKDLTTYFTYEVSSES